MVHVLISPLALRPDEIASDSERNAGMTSWKGLDGHVLIPLLDDDDDIVMPEGPPPGAADEVESDDDIPMPEGPPPQKDGFSQGIYRVLKHVAFTHES